MNTLLAPVRAVGATFTLAAALMAGLPAVAADKPGAPASAAKAHAKKPPKVVDSGSGETAAQRDARLKRECKGRPNAGACLGYAS